MRTAALKVGELARRTGLTVRTLHHYDQIGLLKPSLHSEAGYRLYSAGDVARLQRVLSLRQLGFSLEQVRDCLDREGFSPLEVIGLHLNRLREQIDLQRKLCERLETLAEHLRAASAPGGAAEEVSADQFLQTIEEMTMLEKIAEKYFTPEQRQSIQAERDRVGQAYLEQRQEDWAALIAEVGAEKARGTDPADAKVAALARRWQDLLHWSTGGDPEVEAGMKRMWEERGDELAARFGSKYDSRPVWGYITQAIAAAQNKTSS
jgi:MerR family transcriptional regulator, thiopeptide resistance regulator